MKPSCLPRMASGWVCVAVFTIMLAVNCIERSDPIEAEILQAVRACDQVRAKSIFKSDPAAVSLRTQAEETLLMISVASGCVDLSRYLISIGLDVNARDMEGFTTLMRAARLKDTTLLRLALENGAEVNAVNEYGESAMWDAIGHNNPAALQILIGQGVDTQQADFEGQSPVDAAQVMGYDEILKLLQEAEQED